ncbi:BPTI/Kunitz domain-containing protein 4-like [Anneissia japonica]|uniref:BPTI/Kunitz domain-containing protein 4-like n=1 Tax=Anneissia japonica TaxID=1529436 RepID=UPI001425BAE8|nr:BPTI/Kunitz domain-containing protein 4-like [Anneissia japonica]
MKSIILILLVAASLSTVLAQGEWDCYDKMEGKWYKDGDEKPSGADCGDCVCWAGYWACPSCIREEKVCPVPQCTRPCMYGNKLDENDCFTCDCNPPPKTKLRETFCERFCRKCSKSSKLDCRKKPKCACADGSNDILDALGMVATR